MFFDRFEQLCKEKGVSCKRAVMDMGLSHSIATKWKKTGATPESATLVKVSNYFNVPVSELLSDDLLFGLAPIDPNLAEAAELIRSQPRLDDDAAELLRLMEELNDEGREKLLDYARDLVAGGRYIKSHKHRVGKKA